MGSRVLPGSHLMLTGHSLSQVCMDGGVSWWCMSPDIYFLCVTYCGLFAQGKAEGEN